MGDKLPLVYVKKSTAFTLSRRMPFPVLKVGFMELYNNIKQERIFHPDWKG